MVIKKFSAVLALALVLALSLSPAAFAAGKELIFDDMLKISDKSMGQLGDYARAISGAHKMDVAFFLVSNAYAPEKTLTEYTRAYWSDKGLGPDGFVLVHDIDGKLWSVVSFGAAKRIVTDEVEDRFWAAYNAGDTYFAGAMAYLRAAQAFLEESGGASTPAATGRTLGLVTDNAGLLTGAQWEELDARAGEISAKYRCDVVIVTIVDMGKYGAAYREDAYELAKHFHREYNFGQGNTKRCILFLQATKDRDYALIEYGTDDALTDHGRQVMLDNHILPKLKEDKYYEAYCAYLDRAEYYLEMEAAGTPFDIDNDPEKLQRDAEAKFVAELLFAVGFPLLLARGLTKRWKKKMLTAVAAKEAGQYIPDGGMRLTRQDDQFLYRTQTRVKIETDSSSGGGTSRDSDGYSGSSGKY